MRSALAYRPSRGRLQSAGPGAAVAYLGAPCLIAFVYDSPLVLAGAGAAVVVAGLAAGARDALAQSLRWSLWLGILVVAVNVVVTDRGLTLLVRGPHVPVLGRLDVTAEAIAAGAVLALRILVVGLAFFVYSACVDPDRVLRALRPLAARSALTATLIARMVPVMASDASRLREAAVLRGPGAVAVDRGALIRRLVSGSLDRAVDVAATLELRGYGSSALRPTRVPRSRSRFDARFLATAAAMAGLAVALRFAGVGGFEAYPTVSLDADPATYAFAASLPLLAVIPFVRFGHD